MKMIRNQMNSLDILFFLKENDLNGARIDKLYHRKGEIIIRLYKDKRLILKITRNHIMLIDKFHSDEKADTFTMTMRKHLFGKLNIKQHKFDRVIVIETSGGKLVCEMFRNGNFLICDENFKIILPEIPQEWKTRTLKSGVTYKFPPSENILEDFRPEGKKTIASFLGSHGLGRYGEEICLRAGVDKDKKCDELTDEELMRLKDEMKNLLEDEMKPNIIFKDGEIYDFSPIDLKIYDGFEKKFFETFNSVLNRVFKDVSPEVEKRTDVKELQKEKLKKYEEKEKEFLDTAVFIQENADYIEFFLKSLGDKIKGMRKIKLDVNGRKITLDPSKSIMKNVSTYYERAKEMKRKIEKIKSLLEKDVKIEKPSVEEKKKTDKFRRFITSDGFLVLAGRDAETNEMLIKHHVDKNDIVFHADIVGAPFTVIKTSGKRPSAQAIKEAAQFAACYSRAWKQGLGTVDVYWVKPNQVKKVPGLPKGSFQIQGKRNYLRSVELKLCFKPVKGTVALLPYEVTKLDEGNVIVITPGSTKAKDIISEVKKRFKGYRIPDDLESQIPFGSASILE